MEKLEYCADVIATYGQNIVLVERLREPKGWALPGGRRDMIDEVLEDPLNCAIREFSEETGLAFHVSAILGTYDAANRDPRGPKISTVFYGAASGTIHDEIGKTKVFLLDPAEIWERRDRFVFDHYQILMDWLSLKKS